MVGNLKELNKELDYSKREALKGCMGIELLKNQQHMVQPRHQQIAVTTVFEQKQEIWSQCIVITILRAVHGRPVLLDSGQKSIYDQRPQETCLSDATKRLCVFEVNTCNLQIKHQPERDLVSAGILHLSELS